MISIFAFLNELRDVMLLQESEKVNISRDVEQKMKFLKGSQEGSRGVLGGS